MRPQIRVYVRSNKIQTGEKLVEELYSVKPRTPRAYEMSKDAMYQVKLKKTYSYVLPNEQKTLVEDIKRLCKQYGIEVKVIDVSQEDIIDPWILVQKLWRRLRGIRNFPTVEISRGVRLMAPFSENELERLVSESASPTK